MRRCDFITLLGGVAASTALPLSIRAQQPEQIRRIGVLMGYAESDPAVQSYLAALRGALAKLGWTDGSNLRIELRWGAADPEAPPIRCDFWISRWRPRFRDHGGHICEG
jgi:putative ABC transport system substrate-binding protein